MAARRCAGKTRKGKRCKAAPLRGQKHCAAHDPNRPDEDRFGSPEQAARAGASEKPRVPKLTEVLARKVEERADEIVETLFEALDADRGLVVGAGEDASLELVADHRARLKAVEGIFDRAIGRPRQALEVSGEGGAPVRVDGLFGDAEVRKTLNELVTKVAAGRDERS